MKELNQDLFKKLQAITNEFAVMKSDAERKPFDMKRTQHRAQMPGGASHGSRLIGSNESMILGLVG